MNLTVSHICAIRTLDRVGQGFDAQVKEWRDQLLPTLDSNNEIVNFIYYIECSHNYVIQYSFSKFRKPPGLRVGTRMMRRLMNPLVHTQNLTHRGKAFHPSPQTTTVMMTSVNYLQGMIMCLAAVMKKVTLLPLDLFETVHNPHKLEISRTVKSKVQNLRKCSPCNMFVFCRSSNHVPFVW